jgi:hypothetical protein
MLRALAIGSSCWIEAEARPGIAGRLDKSIETSKETDKNRRTIFQCTRGIIDFYQAGEPPDLHRRS